MVDVSANISFVSNDITIKEATKFLNKWLFSLKLLFVKYIHLRFRCQSVLKANQLCYEMAFELIYRLCLLYLSCRLKYKLNI